MGNKSFVRWGIVGCGDVTEVKSGPAFKQVEGFSLEAVMRRSAPKAADYAARHGVARWYDDADQLIRDPAVDAVYIATPPASHCELALRVAAAGKPCCVEKPMANSVAECDAMNAAFEAAGLPLFVAYYRRSMGHFNVVAQWLAADRVGEPRHVSWRLSKPPSDRDLSGRVNWRTDVNMSPGGYFDDLGSHGLDLLDYLLGPIETVSGLAINQQGLYTTPDAVVASWRHASGVTGSGSWHFGLDSRRDEVLLSGSRGEIRFSVFDEAPVVLETADGVERFDVERFEAVQRPHVENMARALLGSSQHPSTGISAVRTARVMAEILS